MTKTPARETLFQNGESMAREAFEHTVELIHSLDRARSPEEVCRMLLLDDGAGG